MADISVNSHRSHRNRRPGQLEYRVYFVIIFLFALLFAVLGHVWSILRHARSPAIGPVARARAEAHLSSSLIFRG